MAKSVAYKVISHWDKKCMEEEVNEHLGLGWEIVGGVSISRSQSTKLNGSIDQSFLYAQAMTFNKIEETPPAMPAAAADVAALPQANKYLEVEYCLGIGEITKKLMAKYDIIYFHELVGQFLCFRQNKETFNEWLHTNFHTMTAQNRAKCIETISTYVKKNIKI
jgi:hypothetical protein